MNAEKAGSRAGRFHAARRDPAFVVLEGLHALKHAHRFGAELLEIVVCGDVQPEPLAAHLAADTLPLLATAARVSAAEFAALAPAPPPTGVIALARRPVVPVEAVLASHRGRIVLLERPTHAGNIGAAVRVAAAADAGALLTIDGADPWSPAAVRGGAGLQFALPVARIDALPASARPLIAVHPDGEPLASGTLPTDAILAFGSERTGLSQSLLAAAAGTVRIPMRAGVSSLNLATAVAVMLYVGKGEG